MGTQRAGIQRNEAEGGHQVDSFHGNGESLGDVVHAGLFDQHAGRQSCRLVRRNDGGDVGRGAAHADQYVGEPDQVVARTAHGKEVVGEVIHRTIEHHLAAPKRDDAVSQAGVGWVAPPRTRPA
ncbi:hypothetical protein [Propioniciclava flava]